MPKIKKIFAREVLDSRGNPTVEVDLILDTGDFGRAIVPSGASKGEYEALELRDNDKNRYLGKGVLKAISNIENIIFPKIKNLEADVKKIDKILIELDGTSNKSKLGANAILAVSLALTRALANSNKMPLYKYISKLTKTKEIYLPVPLMNIINGGVHADNNLDIQEFMIVPLGFDTFKRALQAAVEVFFNLKAILKERNLSTAVGDEGGFSPKLNNNEEAIKLILEAIEKAGYKAGKHIVIALDSASSSFFKNGFYMFEGKKITSKELIDFYVNLVNKYPIVSLEDGLAENDWDGFKYLTEVLGKKIQIVGDDLFVTNKERLNKGIQQNITNSILIKLNQIGTVSETLEVINLALSNKYTAIISHRSGETEDTFISHLAVGCGCGQIKTGSLSRSERVAKYNELLRIEEVLKEKAKYGSKIFKFKP